MTRTIFHIDVNSAFLSWTAMDLLSHGDANTIDIRTIPSIIGGDQASRHGIVLAKSVPAKAFGIETAEPIQSALRKCPTLAIFPANHQLYHRCSEAFLKLLRQYTPDIQQLSVDECFLDFTPIAHLYESPIAFAGMIQNQITEQLGFTVNIGIAPNRLLAKMASDFTKPNRIHTLYPEEIPAKMWPLPVEDLYMVGKSSSARLRSLGIRTIGELAHTDINYLITEFKSHGKQMWEYANGIADDTIQSVEPERKGVGNSTTVSHDLTTREEACHVLRSLADSVSRRLREQEQLAQTICVEIKYNDFTSVSHQMGLFSPTNLSEEIYSQACKLFDELWNHRPIRLLGIRSTKLMDADSPMQMSIFDFTDTHNKTSSQTSPASVDSQINSRNKKEAQSRLDQALDSIRSRYGSKAVMRGYQLPPKDSDL